jgi:VIT1/CCC1 family predicted Fe2+/Mn2+ transporter
VVAQALSSAEWDKVVTALARIDVPPPARVKHDDLVGGVAIFALANAALLPLAAPYALIANLGLAQRVSNAIALALLFAVGYGLGRYMGERPLRVAVLLVAFGLALVAATIALGG